MELDQLRELFLSADGSDRPRYVAIGLSVALLVFVLGLVRRRALRAEFTPIWVGVAITILIISVRIDLLRWLTRSLGAWTMSSTLFFLGLVFLAGFCLHASVKLSLQSAQLKNLVQETALLREQVERLESRPGAREP